MPTFVEGLIFDLDGTLINSRQDIAASVNHTMTAMGLAPLGMEKISGYVGDGLKNLLVRSLAHFGKEDAVEEAIAVFREHYGQHLLDTTRLYPGVVETLGGLSSKKMAVITNKSEGFTNRILEGLGIRNYFSMVLGGDSLPVKKPHPEPILTVLREWKMAPDLVVMVGDSENDIEAGRQAGIRICAVTYGFKSREELQRYKTDWLIDSITDLKNCVC